MGEGAPSFIVKRLAEIFTIFESVYGKDSPRIMKILPGYVCLRPPFLPLFLTYPLLSISSLTEINHHNRPLDRDGASILAKPNESTWNPNGITMDALPMALSFGQATDGCILSLHSFFILDFFVIALS